MEHKAIRRVTLQEYQKVYGIKAVAPTVFSVKKDTGKYAEEVSHYYTRVGRSVQKRGGRAYQLGSGDWKGYADFVAGRGT